MATDPITKAQIADLRSRLTDAEAAIAGAAGISTNIPQPAGVAAAGVGPLASADDHVHAAQTTITGNAGTATALSAGADRTKLDGIAAGATAEVNADATHAGRVTLGAQTLGTGTKTVDALVSTGALQAANVGVGITPSVDLHLEKASAAAGTIQALAKNTTANGLTQLNVQNSSGNGGGIEVLGTGFSTTGRPTTNHMLILRGSASSGGVAIQAPNSATPIEFWQNLSAVHTKVGEFRGSDGALVVTGDVSCGGVYTNADTALVGRTANNSILFNSTSGDAVARSSSDFYVNIDSNNNGAANKFVVAKDSATAGGGTELFQVNESGATTITGTLAITSTATMGAVALLSQTNTVAGITNKTLVSPTVGTSLILSGGPNITGAAVFVSQSTHSGGWISTGGTRVQTRATTATTVTVGSSDAVLLVDATTGATAVNLQAVTSAGGGREIWVIKIDGTGNAVTINRSGSDTINGANTVALNAQWDKCILTAGATASAAWYRFS